MNRITKKDYYLNIAKSIAERSPCLRRKYGAVIVKEDSIASAGYNGPPRGEEHCKYCVKDANKIPHGVEYKGCRAVHSEVNAIINAARQGNSILNGVLYLWGNPPTKPCYKCERVIKNSGIKEVVIE
jgi:dCMP deaminase